MNRVVVNAPLVGIARGISEVDTDRSAVIANKQSLAMQDRLGPTKFAAQYRDSGQFFVSLSTCFGEDQLARVVKEN